MNISKKLSVRLWAVWPLVGAIITLSILTAKQRWADQQFETWVDDSKPTEQLRNIETLADTLLADSILSIVQSYYVDPTRIRNSKLIIDTFKALSEHPKISFQQENNNLHLTINNTRSSYVLEKVVTYQKMLDIFSTVAAQIHHENLEFPEAQSENKISGTVALLNVLLSNLDAHSVLLNPEAYRELRQGTEGSFGGLGVLVGIRESLLTVIKPLPRSPAKRAGLKENDRILSINGYSTYGQTLDQLVEHMRGAPGTKVDLNLLRAKEASPVNISMEREIIHIDSVTPKQHTVNGAKILQLSIDSFSSRTSSEVLSAIKRAKIRNNGELDGLILDLRSNPGGLLDQAVQVADLFLESGVIVSTKGRRNETETAGSGFDEVDLPLVVLVNNDSASASEIVAGALQDHNRAIIIGQPSFGKGSVQTVFELPGERALKLTIARYYTPQGRSIQNVGIIPDIWLQPVYGKNSNSNLFGPYRYKNERFLKNHLSAQLLNTNAQKSSAFKAYYKVDEAVGENAQAKDQELEMAFDIFDTLKHSKPAKSLASQHRSSYWLGIAGPKLNEKKQLLEQKLNSWLEEAFQVDWRPTKRSGNIDAVKLQLDKADKIVASKPGETIDFAWKLSNPTDAAIDRLSIFVRSQNPFFETEEILIGRLPAHTQKHGIYKFRVPTNWDPGSIKIRFGLAKDAWPLNGQVQNLTIKVQPRDVAVLDSHAYLENERGGNLVGILEPTEKGTIEIQIFNTGLVDANNVNVSLLNLSGSQVNFENKKLSIDSIDAGDSKLISLQVEAGAMLYNDNIKFGVVIDSADLKAPVRQELSIRSKSSHSRKKMSTLIGH